MICGTDVPSCSKDLGNTITKSNLINPAIKWCFTLNNYTEEEYSAICSNILSLCRYGIVGREVSPTNNTPHLQGYIEFTRKKRPLGAFNNPRIHWEKAKGNKLQNVEYCSKEDKVPYIFPTEWKVPLKKEDFYVWENYVYDILIQEPDPRKIIWLYDEVGCSGKTTFSKWLYQNLDGVIVLSGSGDNMKNGIIEYLEVNHKLPTIVIMNIPRTKKNFMSWCGIEEIKDMFFFSGKYHGGFVCGKPPALVCLANSLPDVRKVSLDRWDIFHIVDEGLERVYVSEIENEILS